MSNSTSLACCKATLELPEGNGDSVSLFQVGENIGRDNANAKVNLN